MEEMNSDHEMDVELRRLQERLMQPSESPLGLETRLIARTRKVDRQDIPWEARVIIACIAFVILGFNAPDLLSGPSAVLLSIAATGYVLTLRRNQTLHSTQSRSR